MRCFSEMFWICHTICQRGVRSDNDKGKPDWLIYGSVLWEIMNSFLASGDVLSSTDNLCKQFGSRSGLTKCQS